MKGWWWGGGVNTLTVCVCVLCRIDAGFVALCWLFYDLFSDTLWICVLCIILLVLGLSGQVLFFVFEWDFVLLSLGAGVCGQDEGLRGECEQDGAPASFMAQTDSS